MKKELLENIVLFSVIIIVFIVALFLGISIGSSGGC